MGRLRRRELIRGGREGASCLRGRRKDGKGWLLTSQGEEAAQAITGHQEPPRGPGSANRAAVGLGMEAFGVNARGPCPLREVREKEHER